MSAEHVGLNTSFETRVDQHLIAFERLDETLLHFR